MEDYKSKDMKEIIDYQPLGMKANEVGVRTPFLSWMLLSSTRRAKNFCPWSLKPDAVTLSGLSNPLTMAFCSSVLNCGGTQTRISGFSDGRTT